MKCFVIGRESYNSHYEIFCKLERIIFHMVICLLVEENHISHGDMFVSGRESYFTW